MWRITAAVSAIGLIALAAMFIWVKSLQADLKTAAAVQKEQSTVITAQNTQITEVKNAKDNADKARLLEKSRADLSDQTNADLAGQVDDLKTRAEKERKYVSKCTDDGPAAPVLEYAANSMRLISARIASLRPRDSGQGGVSGMPDPGALETSSPAARGSWPTGQCQFADIALAWGFYAEQLAVQLSKLPAWEASYNEGTANASKSSQ